MNAQAHTPENCADCNKAGFCPLAQFNLQHPSIKRLNLQGKPEELETFTRILQQTGDLLKAATEAFGADDPRTIRAKEYLAEILKDLPSKSGSQESDQTGPQRIADFLEQHGIPGRDKKPQGSPETFARIRLTKDEMDRLPAAVNQVRAIAELPAREGEFSITDCNLGELFAALELIWPEDDPRWIQLVEQFETNIPDLEPEIAEHQFCQRDGNTLHIALWRFELDALTSAMTELHIHPDDGKMGKGQLLSAFNLSRVWQTPDHPGWQQLMAAVQQDDTAVFTVIFELQPLAFQTDVEAYVEAQIALWAHEFDEALGSLVDQMNDALDKRDAALDHKTEEMKALYRRYDYLVHQVQELRHELERRTLRYKVHRWWTTSWSSPGHLYEVVKRLNRRRMAIRWAIDHFGNTDEDFDRAQTRTILVAGSGDPVKDDDWHEVFPTPWMRFRFWRNNWRDLLRYQNAWTVITNFNAWRYIFTHRDTTMFTITCALTPGYAIPTYGLLSLAANFRFWDETHSPFWRWNIFTREFWREGGQLQRKVDGKWFMSAREWQPDPWRSYSHTVTALYAIWTVVFLGLMIAYFNIASHFAKGLWDLVIFLLPMMLLALNFNPFTSYLNWREAHKVIKQPKSIEKDKTTK